MKRYCVELAFDGTYYFGYQIQNYGNTVQGEIERCLSLLLNEPISTIGCGRTDSGVHAKQFYLHFDTSRELTEKFLYQINGVLPNDIVFNSCNRVSDQFHARFDAIYREYQYYVHWHKSAFHHHSFYYFYDKINYKIDQLNNYAAYIMSVDDFTSFCKTGSDNKSNLCEIYFANWKSINDQIVFTISANRFLRGMVRLIVGAQLNLARKKMNIEEYLMCIENKTKLPINWSVPAHGLFLTKVDYP